MKRTVQTEQKGQKRPQERLQAGQKRSQEQPQEVQKRPQEVQEQEQPQKVKRRPQEVQRQPQKAKKQLEKLVESVDILQDILDTEQYGMCVVDSEGRVVKWNYEKLFNIREEEVLGRPVTEVLENTRLHIVVKTGKKELFQLQEIHGSHVIANRIPIFCQGESIGAAGTIVFKDVKELKDLWARLEKTENRYRDYRSELASMYSARYSFDDIYTESTRMEELKELCRVVARTEASILLLGESGTGKEMFAQAIHNESMASHEPFVSLNCSSIPKDLLESELFGYAPGAFTGAKRDGKMGKFELAGNGTIFLDEIGTMPMDMQVKLLRVLESRELERVGSTKKTSFGARVIAATNDNLEQAMEEGTFRKDLYYRLNVVTVKIPPLRERKEDLACLCQALLGMHCKKYKWQCPVMAEETMSVLRTHDWPGNVRELRNVLERALILSGGETILPQHLPDALRKSDSALRFEASVPFKECGESYYKQEIARLEQRMICQALAECGGNRKEAAELLGIHRSLLYKKMETYEIS